MRRTGLLQVIKTTINGAPADQLADIEAQLRAEKTNVAAAVRELEQLEQQRRLAADYDAARGLDEALARARWTIERADAVIPPLEAELAAALADRRREALARHRAAIAKIYPRLRVAIEAAAAVQADAIAARQAAIAELGEGVVQANLTTVAFMGLLLPDLIQIWAAEMDRAFAAAPQPKPARAPSAPARPQPVETDRAHAVGLNDRPVTPRVRRQLRRDSHAGEGHRLITFVRSGVEAGNLQSLAGDVVAMPIETANSLVKSGAAEFAGEPGPTPQSAGPQTGKPE